MLTTNQNLEQLVQNRIDEILVALGWVVQSKNKINPAANTGAAVREYQTDISSTDYILFVNKKPAGVIEAKREEEGLFLPSARARNVTGAYFIC
jgi:type I restriction enzyme R subunit